MDQEKALTFLEKIDLFEGIPRVNLEKILGDSYQTSFERNETLFYQDDPAKNFYVLLEGRIKLSQLTLGGDQVTLHYLHPGEAFGIIAVLREISFPVTAEAVEESVCIGWTDEMMKKWILAYPQIALNSIRILSKFILTFQDRIRELSTERVEQRVARSLLRLAQHGGEKTSEGVSLGMKLTRQDIADMSGTTLYTVSRVLTKWERMGLVICGKGPVVIKEPHLLTELAEDLGDQAG